MSKSPRYSHHLILSFLIALLPAFAQGQCIMGNLNAPQTDPTNVDIGQSFTPTCNGVIEYVEIFTTNGGTNAAGTLRIFNNSTVLGTPIHTQAYPAITVNPGEAIRVYLSTPIPVTAFAMKTFEVELTVEIPFSGGNPYSGGRLFYNGTNSSVHANSDIKFNVSVLSNCDDSYSSITADACQTYTSPSGLLWDSTGVYTDTIPNLAGCDSIITVDLNVTTLDTTVTLNGLELTANEADATGYQWLDCDNGNAPIPGADQQSYLATASGNYAVELTLGNCTVVSDCFFVGSTSIPDRDAERISVWPNPSNGVVQIAGIGEQDRLLVKDALGQEVPTQRTGARLVLPDATPGLYFLQVLRPDGRSVSRRFLVR